MMKVCRSVLGMVQGLVVASLLSGCGSPFPKLRGDRAFIKYWPPPAGGTPLRVAVKDNIDMKDEVTTAGSEYYARKGERAVKDAACLDTVRRPGVWIVGRTNLNELALGVTGVNSYFGTPKNRLGDSRRLMPGGSSSGSAVAVARGRADVAIATDTAGSIRTPAACCGVYGLKTTFGLVSLKGVYPISPRNLDTVGPMAADIDNLAAGMDLLKPGTGGQYAEAQAARPTGRGIRVGRLYIPGTDANIDEAVDEALKNAGFTVVRLDERFLKAWEEATKHGQTIAVADGYVTDKELLGEKGVSTNTKAAILLGDLKYGSGSYREALRYRKVWRRELQRVFQRVDFIALPTIKSHPMKIPFLSRLVVFEARALGLQNTVAVNYAGNPAIAIPVPVKDERVPVTSLQLIGPKLSEAKLLNGGRIVASKQR